MIYVLFGPSGSGKTTLLEQVRNEYGNRSIHIKGTTRSKRRYDDVEIDPDFTEEDLSKKYGEPNGYIYSQYGHKYGIERAQIDAAIQGGYPHFVICNDIDTVQKMRKDYGVNIYVVYVRYNAARATIEEIQKTRGITDDEIELRLSKIDFLEKLYMDNGDLFDDVLHNKYGETPFELWKKMQAIMKSVGDHNELPTRQIIFDTIDYLRKVIEETETNRLAVADKVEKGFVFIIMPMMKGDDNIANELWNVYTTIKDSAFEAGFRADRVDNIIGSQTIDSKICEHIEKAEIIVADLSYERPNCYYELGYAKALGKEMIIISKQGTKVHFDVEHYDNITYNNPRQLGMDLKTKFFVYNSKKK